MSAEILTVGHSTLDYESFLQLLRESRVTAVADVRSYPHSRRLPQFNREILQDELPADRISYVFLGDELGGRPKNPDFYCEGIADYEKMANDEKFQSGIGKVIEGTKRYRIALMCSEHNPLDCHRCLLVGRSLFERGISIRHILSFCHTISQEEVEAQRIRHAAMGKMICLHVAARV